MITKKTKRALEIIKKRRLTASQFSRLIWPDSAAHKKVTNGGSGAQRGKGAWLSAGSYLAKLERRGLVRRCSDSRYFTITSMGQDALDDYREVTVTEAMRKNLSLIKKHGLEGWFSISDVSEFIRRPNYNLGRLVEANLLEIEYIVDMSAKDKASKPHYRLK